jgi:hypothetical protein
MATPVTTTSKVKKRQKDMTRQMTDDEVTVLEVIIYLQDKGNEAFSEDIRKNCILTEDEILAALSSLRAEADIHISPRGWATA